MIDQHVFCDVNYVAEGKFSVKWYLDDFPTSQFKASFFFAVEFHQRGDYNRVKCYYVRVRGKVRYQDIVGILEKLHNRRSKAVYAIEAMELEKAVETANSWRTVRKSTRFKDGSVYGRRSRR